jgi:putative lipase involved disintegration of autophagic bodies
MLGGPTIKRVIDLAVETALEEEATMVCGHSLGGLIAEVVCTRTGIPGASFNAPGPCGLINLADPEKASGVPFECHITEGDIVSKIGNHIRDPIINYHGGGHSISNLKKELIKGIDYK